MIDNKENLNLYDFLKALNPHDRVKVVFNSGIYFCGTAKKAQKILKIQNDLEIKKIDESFIAIPFRINLVKETKIFI